MHLPFAAGCQHEQTPPFAMFRAVNILLILKGHWAGGSLLAPSWLFSWVQQEETIAGSNCIIIDIYFERGGTIGKLNIFNFMRKKKMICEFCDEKLACTPMLSVPGPSYQLARLLTATGGKKCLQLMHARSAPSLVRVKWCIPQLWSIRIMHYHASLLILFTLIYVPKLLLGFQAS